MKRLIKINNTVFCLGKNTMFPLSYRVFTFRKRGLSLHLSDIRSMVLEADRLDSVFQERCSLLNELNAVFWKAKASNYRKRTDLERSLLSIIAIPVRCKSFKLLDLWAWYFNGNGYSTAGKQLKPITCTEKRRKCLVSIINLLRDLC